jgi:hypothetical protein
VRATFRAQEQPEEIVMADPELVVASALLIGIATVAGAWLARQHAARRELCFGAAAGALLVIAGLHLLPDAWSAAPDGDPGMGHSYGRHRGARRDRVRDPPGVRLATWVLGDSAACRRAYNASLEERLAAAERSQDLRAKRARAVEEFAALLRRIERDLHDGAQVRISQLVDAPNMLVSAFLPEDIFTS